MSKYVDLSERVTATYYDQECEEWTQKTVTVADILDRVCDDYTVLPTIDAVPQWIPCSERLPEEYGNYLITTHDGNVDIGTIDPKKKSVWSACDADGFYWLRGVVAWMPLPKPPKGEEE